MLRQNMIVASHSIRGSLFVSLLCAAFLIVAGDVKSAAAQSELQFEGEVAMKMNSPEIPGRSMEMTYFIKGERSRIETNIPNIPNAQGVVIMDLSSGRMTTLIPQQKMYMTVDMKEVTKIAEGMEKSARGQYKLPKITATGRHETIAGHICEHWLMIEGKQEIDMCVAKGLGYFGMGGGRGGLTESLMFNPQMAEELKNNPEWPRFLEGGAFPLKLTLTESGRTSMSMEATRIEPKKLDDSLFTVPPDYKEMKMPSIPSMPNVPKPPKR